jgi:hypothetical protein
VTNAEEQEIIVHLSEAGRLEDSLRDDESDTMDRLRNCQVKLDAGRYEHYAGSQR